MEATERPDGEHAAVGALSKHGRVQMSGQSSFGQRQVLHLGRYLCITLLDDRLHHQAGTFHDRRRRMLDTDTHTHTRCRH